MPRYLLDIHIDAQEWLRFYAGRAHQVHAVARCGTRVAFPASWLRGVVSHTGVQGTFVLDTDAQHRLKRLARAAC